MNKLLSVVIPAFNEENIIQDTINTLSKVLYDAGIPFELIFVDDGSIDKTWDILSKNSQQYDYVKAISFSRNFGKESAIFAGLKYAVGDCCVVMDCDLQHPPKCVVEMYKIWLNNDIDIIEGKKSNRGKEFFPYKLCAKLFYKILRATSGINLENASDFKLLDRKVVDTIKDMPERQTFFRAMSGWVGFKTTQIFYDVPQRNSSKSKWTFKSLSKFAVNSLTSYTTVPMYIVLFFGAAFFIFASALAVLALYQKIAGIAVEGFTTVIILLLIIGSIIMFSLGIIGIYLSKIYEEVKYRPKYIIRDKAGCDEKERVNIGS